MNAVWQVQEAKNRFSELIDSALNEGPQLVTRHGRAVVRVVAVDAPDEAKADDGFAAYLLDGPRIEPLDIPSRRGRKAAPLLGD
jgi:antitoxin Phd